MPRTSDAAARLVRRFGARPSQAYPHTTCSEDRATLQARTCQCARTGTIGTRTDQTRPWADRDSADRDSWLLRSAWGGQISSWGTQRLSTDTYIIPKRITIEEIADALDAVLLPSDAALLAYPYGSTRTGASAMRIRLFGADAQTRLGADT